MLFVDRVRILARAGNGGRGGLSFLREKGKPNGGPDGGNGGKGGDVILVVNPHLNNLIKLKYSPHQYAKNGMPGMGRQCSGKAGEDCIIEVAPGTVVSRVPSDDIERPEGDLSPVPAPGEELEIVADLTTPGEKLVICSGGKGGRGNMNFKSSTNQAPRRFETGLPGESGEFILELKSIADIGLVGYPNAGKSTLLSRLSNAKPKIAPYPFTTLQPMVGVVDYSDYRRITVADIPGLIEGAHEGVGLGHEFLRHIERCGLLLFVLDMGGSEGRDPLDDFAKLRKELRLYLKELGERPFLIVANKMDLADSKKNLTRFRKKYKYPIIPITAETSEGIEELRKRLLEFIDPQKP